LYMSLLSFCQILLWRTASKRANIVLKSAVFSSRRPNYALHAQSLTTKQQPGASCQRQPRSNGHCYPYPGIRACRSAELTTKPEAGAHLTLSRVSAPRVGGGPSSFTRVWLASRRIAAGPRSAWRVVQGNGSEVKITSAELSPRHTSHSGCLHGSPFLENQCFGLLVTQCGPQDTSGAAGRGHACDSGRLGFLELVGILPQDRLV
jgi:hypothetical protein